MGVYSIDNFNDIRLPKDACVFIVRTEWNKEIVDRLEEGAVNCLKHFNVNHKVIYVPGAVEIAFAVKKCWDYAIVSSRPSAFITLGCVIKGDTPHFEYVCQAAVNGNTQLNLMLPVPTIFGILTVNDSQQAVDRIGGIHGHKGEEAALTALKMISFSNATENPVNR